MSDPDLHHLLGPLLLEHAPCWVYVVNGDCGIVQANRALQIDLGQVAGRRCYQLLRGREAPCEPCVAEVARRTGEPATADEEVLLDGGRELHYSVRAVPLGPGGAEGWVVLFALNTTQECQLAEQLRQAERLASVGLTTAGLAHSIKNILAGLEGGMYLMQAGLQREDPDRIAGAWQMVARYIEQVTLLVKNMLSYAREQRPKKEPADPARLIDEMIELYSSKGELVGIRLERDLPPALPPVDLDYKGVHSCLANLVANAFDACTWDPDTDKEHVIRLSARARDGGGVVLEVADNGMGISAENQRKILRASFTTKGMRGTGLGLLLTQKVVREHGGGIGFQSEPGKGTTFTIEIPAQIDDSGGTMTEQRRQAHC